MPVPNEKLRAARLRTPSRLDPKSPMPRRELAELVALHVWDHHGEAAAIDGRYVGKLERGVVRWPSARYREAVKAILGARTDAELGFAPTGSHGRDVLLDDVNRRDLLRGSAAAGSLAVTAPGVTAAMLLDALGGTPPPARVGVGDIEQVRTAARAVSAWSFAHGGAFALRAGEGQLRWATGLLTARCPERLEPALHSAVSRLADACGFAAFDGHEFARARRMFEAARQAAETAGNWPLRASALADTALLELWLGQPDAALTCLEMALVRSERLAPVEQAMVWATMARAHGQLGDVQATLRAVGTADERFAAASPGDETPLGYYTASEHAGTCGTALYDLVLVTGTAAPGAVERQHDAIAGFGDEYARSRVLAQAQLGTVLMLTGDPDQGAACGIEALADAGALQSPRSTRYFQVLDEAARPHQGRDTVDELHQRTRQLLAAA